MPNIFGYSPTPEEEAAATIPRKRGAAYARFQATAKVRRGIWAMNDLPKSVLDAMGLDHASIKKLNTDFREATRDISHTFHICNTCNKALRGRSIRKDNKHTGYGPCQICDAQTSVKHRKFVTTYKIHHSTTLAEARTYIRTNSPEIFL